MNSNKFIFNDFICVCVITLAVCISGCSKSDSGSSIKSSDEFFEIVINGQKYREVLDPGNFSGFDNQTTCDGKRGYELNIWDGNLNNKYDVNTDIIHYKNEVDFKNAKTGNFIFSTGSSTCNFSFYCTISDNSIQNKQASLMSGATHSVTSIKLISTSNGKKEYLISGNFSASYKNSANSTITVSGAYQKSIEVLQ